MSENKQAVINDFEALMLEGITTAAEGAAIRSPSFARWMLRSAAWAALFHGVDVDDFIDAAEGDYLDKLAALQPSTKETTKEAHPKGERWELAPEIVPTEAPVNVLEELFRRMREEQGTSDHASEPSNPEPSSPDPDLDSSDNAGPSTVLVAKPGAPLDLRALKPGDRIEFTHNDRRVSGTFDSMYHDSDYAQVRRDDGAEGGGEMRNGERLWLVASASYTAPKKLEAAKPEAVKPLSVGDRVTFTDYCTGKVLTGRLDEDPTQAAYPRVTANGYGYWPAASKLTRALPVDDTVHSG